MECTDPSPRSILAITAARDHVCAAPTLMRLTARARTQEATNRRPVRAQSSDSDGHPQPVRVRHPPPSRAHTARNRDGATEECANRAVPWQELQQRPKKASHGKSGQAQAERRALIRNSRKACGNANVLFSRPRRLDRRALSGLRHELWDAPREARLLHRVQPRVISDCRFAVQLNHFIPGFLSY